MKNAKRRIRTRDTDVVRRELAGNCARQPPRPRHGGAANTGTVVFFREKKFAGAAISYKVRENGVEICKLKSGRFCSVQAPAGKHEYVVHSEAKDVLTLEVEPGETYYVIGAISVGFLAGHPNLSPSDKGAFEGMKAKLKDNTGQDLDPADEKEKKK